MTQPDPAGTKQVRDLYAGNIGLDNPKITAKVRHHYGNAFEQAGGGLKVRPVPRPNDGGSHFLASTKFMFSKRRQSAPPPTDDSKVTARQAACCFLSIKAEALSCSLGGVLEHELYIIKLDQLV